MESQNELQLKFVETALRRFLEGCCLRVESGMGSCQLSPPLRLSVALDGASRNSSSVLTGIEACELVPVSRPTPPADCPSSDFTDGHRVDQQSEAGETSGTTTFPALQQEQLNFNLNLNFSGGQGIQLHSGCYDHSSTTTTEASTSHVHFCAALLSEEPHEEPIPLDHKKGNQGTAHCGLSQAAADYVADGHSCWSLRGVPYHPLYKRLALALFHAAKQGEETRVGTMAAPERFRAAWEASSSPHALSTPSPPSKARVDHGHGCDEGPHHASEKSQEQVRTVLQSILKMRNDVKAELHVQSPYYEQLRSGEKTVEGRCADAKYRNLNANDVILFNQALFMRVVRTVHYASFWDMLESEGLSRALPQTDSLSAGAAIYRRFYSAEREKENGVLAIHVERVNLVNLVNASTGQVAGYSLGLGVSDSNEDCQDVPEIVGRALHRLGCSGTCRLIGMSLTEGSVPEALPPPRTRLIHAFNALHKAVPASKPDGASKVPPSGAHVAVENRLCHATQIAAASELGSAAGVKNNKSGGLLALYGGPSRDAHLAAGRVLGTTAAESNSGESESNELPAGPMALEPESVTRGTTAVGPMAFGPEPVTRGTVALGTVALEPEPDTRGTVAVGSVEAKGARTAKSESGGGALLTVGARALCKHSHRDSWHAFWRRCSGPEAEKNRIANAEIEKILDNATWMNTHVLPGGVAVFEARVTEGYGARWSADGAHFRGLLEPPMEAGHELKWRH